MSAVLPFRRRIGNPAKPATGPLKPARGEVFVYPCANDDGCWGVEHISASGNSMGHVGTFFSLAEAEREAEAAAKRLNARYVGGVGI